MLRWFRRRGEETSPEEITPSVITADEFAARLEALTPPVEELMDSGMTQSEAEDIRSIWFCHRVSQSGETDPLLDLCNNFDLSTLDIGTVTFIRPVELVNTPFDRPRGFDEDFLVIGYMEADPIVYPKDRGIINVRDHGYIAHEICKCARTPEGFLAALLVVAEFNSRKSRMTTDEKKAAGERAMIQCLSFAGKECGAFYANMMGIY